MDRTATLDSVRSWPIGERLSLVFEIWDQLIDDQWKPEPTDDLIAELDQRLDDYEANPSKVRTWDQVRESLRRAR